MKIKNLTRRINGYSIPAEDVRDGIQRSESLYDNAGNRLGHIFTARRTDLVTAHNNKGEVKHLAAAGITKDQCFSTLRVWVVGTTLGLAK